jgi:RNase adaptor protein for sRNA GlmZ degradation
MKLHLISTGKSSVLNGSVHADLFIDCRGMVNPYRDPALGHLTGDSPEMQDWIKEKNAPYVRGVLAIINTAIISFPTRGGGAGKGVGVPLTVCFFCLAGVHRSRGMKHVIAEALIKSGHEVEVL